MYVIVGLGNPGKRYEQTRHNLGFLTVDYLAEELGVSVKKLKHKALVGEGTFGRQRFMLVKPQTYMNLSGESLREIATYYKVDHQKLIVIYDDLDIGLGTIRIRKKGSAGTHNGMRSIIGSLGWDDFPRIRIGIGAIAGQEIKGDVKDYVTGGFRKGEKDLLEKAVIQASQAIKAFMEHGIDRAMNEYNGNC